MKRYLAILTLITTMFILTSCRGSKPIVEEVSKNDSKIIEKSLSDTNEEESKEEKPKQDNEEYDKKFREYMGISDKVKSGIEKNLKNKHEGYVINYIDSTATASDETITIEVNVKTNESTTVGELTAIRNEISQEVDKVASYKKLKIKLKYNDKDAGEYIFTMDDGWDKDVTPIK